MKWSNQNPLRVALLDDHALIRNGIRDRLEQERDIEVVAVYASSRELLAGLKTTPVDVLILDYSLQQDELDGHNLIRLIRIRFATIRILVCSATESPAVISLSLRAGVCGFIGKTQEVDELVRAVRVVAKDQIYLNQEIAHELGHVPAAEDEPPVRTLEEDNSNESVNDSALVSNPLLSPREQEVLRCCLDGMSVTQIAEKFNRSRKTISAQKQSAFRKLGVRTNIELFKIHGASGGY